MNIAQNVASITGLSVSAVLGIYKDVELTGTQCSWLGSMFFIGHLVCQPINNIMLQKVPVGRYVGICIFLWVLVMLGTSFCNNFHSLYVYLTVNTLFRRSEQTVMYGAVTMGSGFGSIFGAVPGESILLKTPGGTALLLGVLFATIVARRTGQICYTGAFMSTLSLTGCIILAVVKEGSAKLAGLYISWMLTAGYNLLITTIGSNVSGKYVGAMTGFCIGNAVAIASYLVMRFVMAKENESRLVNLLEKETDATLDLTDMQDKNFIYKL
ncbi:hypothetical protein BDC45DRAFT_530886 [Circinella umbellata]|nr:hypothetical protein BDC45DRAFT_530886 [Circinella umbellata]